jgi:thiol:disulfide interchange protein DsbD
MTGVQRIFGVMMLGMAVWLLSRVATATTIMTFFAVLLLGLAIFFGIYRSHERKVFNRCLGATSGIAALFLIVALNTPSVINVISHSTSSESAFITVRTVDEIRHQISLAQASGKPVMLDFYADWCESCVVMDKKVFTLPDVIHGLNKFVLLRADLSKNSVADEIMLKSFEVVAPPTVLFFNNYGQEVNSRRIVGELDAMEFMTRVNTFITASCDKNSTC